MSFSDVEYGTRKKLAATLYHLMDANAMAFHHMYDVTLRINFNYFWRFSEEEKQFLIASAMSLPLDDVRESIKANEIISPDTLPLATLQSAFNVMMKYSIYLPELMREASVSPSAERKSQTPSDGIDSSPASSVGDQTDSEGERLMSWAMGESSRMRKTSQDWLKGKWSSDPVREITVRKITLRDAFIEFYEEGKLVFSLPLNEYHRLLAAQLDSGVDVNALFDIILNEHQKREEDKALEYSRGADALELSKGGIEVLISGIESLSNIEAAEKVKEMLDEMKGDIA